MDLSDKRRKDRIQLAGQIVLKLSITIDVLKDIKEKRDVAKDVVIFIDAIKDHLLQTVLKQDLNDLSECVYHRPPNDEGEDHSATIFLLQTCSKNDYTAIADSILVQFDVCKDKLPSFFRMIKQHPKYKICQARLSHLKKLRVISQF